VCVDALRDARRRSDPLPAHGRAPAIDVPERDGELLVHADLPGVDVRAARVRMREYRELSMWTESAAPFLRAISLPRAVHRTGWTRRSAMACDYSYEFTAETLFMDDTGARAPHVDPRTDSTRPAASLWRHCDPRSTPSEHVPMATLWRWSRVRPLDTGPCSPVAAIECRSG
jgi:hypothetical protein